MASLFEARTLIDILIIAIIIFAIYRTLLATGTWKIAVGLGFAVLLAVLAKVLGLQGTEWIFSNFSPIAILMLLIIFQPEIRRILERGFFFGQLRAMEENVSVSELIDQALFDLAERNWGALVVIPGKIPLQQWISQGTILDGIVSGPLLLSLFDPGSPGHDGAVIVAVDRVNSFSVHLPLSQSNKLADGYGTRHNAALGLSEKTDALIFVVSEERGVVSAFRDGRHIMVKKRGDVSDLTKEHYDDQQGAFETKQSKRRLWPALIGFAVCFVFSVFLWATLIQPRTVLREMFFTVPIEYLNKDKKMAITDKMQEAKLLIRGPVSSLKNLDPSTLRIQVNLAGLEEGRHRIDLENQNIVSPKKFRIIEIDPPSLEIQLDRSEGGTHKK